MRRKLTTVVVDKPKKDDRALHVHFGRLLRNSKIVKKLPPKALTSSDKERLTELHNEILRAKKRMFKPDSMHHAGDLILLNTRRFAFNLWTIHRLTELVMANGFTARIVDDCRSGKAVPTVQFVRTRAVN
jgi:hypothetical protein